MYGPQANRLAVSPFSQAFAVPGFDLGTRSRSMKARPEKLNDFRTLGVSVFVCRPRGRGSVGAQRRCCNAKRPAFLLRRK